jgi:hypothetical protein
VDLSAGINAPASVLPRDFRAALGGFAYPRLTNELVMREKACRMDARAVEFRV